MTMTTTPTSQHPADLKPRGLKDPMHLIPWSVVPARDCPEGLAVAAGTSGVWPNGDPVIPAPDSPMFRFAQALVSWVVSVVGFGPIARAFEHGAKKYARDNWREFTWDQAGQDSYLGAAVRHMTAWYSGEELDPESGVPHLGHVGACGLIWSWHLVYGAGAVPAECPAPAPPVPPFKVGDRVTWDEHSPLCWGGATTPAGEGIVETLDTFQGVPCAHMGDTEERPWWFRLSDLRPVAAAAGEIEVLP